MKKLIKIFSWLIVIIIFLIIVLAVVAKLAENKITDIALKKVSESIEAPVEIDRVSFNLLRKFPLATIELHNVVLGAHKLPDSLSFISDKTDTIANISKVYVSVKSKPLLKGNIDIIKVDIEGASINYLVDTSGTSNIDFLITTSDNEETDTLPSKPLNINLTDLSLKDITCNYSDQKIKATAKVAISEIKVKANIDGENIMASVFGDLSLSNCSFDETNLYLMNKTDINFDIDYENDSLYIKQLDVLTDGAKLNLLGSVVLNDEINTDIRFQGSNIILDELIKYAPKEMLNEFGLEKLSGKMNLEASIKGIYSDSELPHVDLNIIFQNGSIITKDYPNLKNISFKGNLTNGILRNNQSTQANFSTFHFETDKSKFELAFSVLDIDHPKYEIKTDMMINVGEFSKFIPDSLLQYIDGNIKADFTTKGELPDSIGDDFVDYILANSRANIELTDFNVDVDSNLSVKNFSTKLIYKPNSIEVSDLNLSIPAYNAKLINTAFNAHFNESINNTSEMSLDLKSYHVEMDNSEFKGYAQIKNFDNPSYTFTSTINLNLEELKKYLPDSLITTIRGKVYADIESSGTLNLDSIADQAMDIVFRSSSVKFNFENVLVEMPDDPLYKMENLFGSVSMDPEMISIMKMKGLAGGIEFGIDSTTIENVYNTVIKNKKEQLKVNTRINLGDIDYAMFAPFMLSDSTAEVKTANETTVSEPTNYTMLIKGVAKVKSLTYDKAFIEDISTLFKVTDSVYIVDQFKFKAFDGWMSNSVKYMLKPDKAVIETHHIVEKMDVQKLLADFDNFEEYYEPSIRSENLSGLFSTNLYTRVNMIGDSLIMDDIRARGGFAIEDGGVYDFEPATSMAKFTGIDELDNIKFKTLESKIFVIKNAIYIPETFISSTALNITAYGMQSLADDYEYHLEIKLSDILFGKGKKQKKKESKAGDEGFKDDRNMRELFYEEIDGKIKYGFDTDDKQRTMKSKIKAQERLLNLRFDPGMFNFDTKVYSDK